MANSSLLLNVLQFVIEWLMVCCWKPYGLFGVRGERESRIDKKLAYFWPILLYSPFLSSQFKQVFTATTDTTNCFIYIEYLKAALLNAIYHG